MRLGELATELRAIKTTIDRLLKKSKYRENGDLSDVDLDYTDPDQILLRNEFRAMMEQMEDISATLSILDAPIIYTGTLFRRPDGRYGTEDGFYYTSGKQIEALVDDPTGEEPAQWVLGRVEFDTDYYIVGYRNAKMDGLLVRRRENPFI